MRYYLPIVLFTVLILPCSTPVSADRYQLRIEHNVHTGEKQDPLFDPSVSPDEYVRQKMKQIDDRERELNEIRNKSRAYVPGYFPPGHRLAPQYHQPPIRSANRIKNSNGQLWTMVLQGDVYRAYDRWGKHNPAEDEYLNKFGTKYNPASRQYERRAWKPGQFSNAPENTGYASSTQTDHIATSYSASSQLHDQSASYDRPSFIPAYAYTNDDMYALYGMIIPLPFLPNLPISKNPIPPQGTGFWILPSIATYWGEGWNKRVWARCHPVYGHPGHFTFESRKSGGPRGWLQYTGERGERGYPKYRYWFDRK